MWRCLTEKDDKAMAVMLSQTRKMGLFAVLAHQNWSQTSPRLRGALQNTGLKVSFALDYDDALITARIIGRVEPVAIREDTKEGSETTGMQEQWQEIVQQFQDMWPGQALVRKRLKSLRKWRTRWPFNRWFKGLPSALYHVKTPYVPDPTVDEAEIREIEDHYLKSYFTALEDIKADEEEVREAEEMERKETGLKKRKVLFGR